MQDVSDFVGTFEEFPPRSYPPSFVPSKIMEQEKTKLKAKKAIKNYEKNMMPQKGEKQEETKTKK